METNAMNAEPTIDIDDDPIVQEVRKIRQQIFESYDCDIHKYFEGMRQLQETCGHPIYRATSKSENLSASPAAGCSK